MRLLITAKRIVIEGLIWRDCISGAVGCCCDTISSFKQIWMLKWVWLSN